MNAIWELMKLMVPFLSISGWVVYNWRNGSHSTLVSGLPMAFALMALTLTTLSLNLLVYLGLGVKSAWLAATVCGVLILLSGYCAMRALLARVYGDRRVKTGRVLGGIIINVLALFSAGMLASSQTVMATELPYTFTAPQDAYKIDLPLSTWMLGGADSDAPTIRGMTRWSMFNVNLEKIGSGAGRQDLEAVYATTCAKPHGAVWETLDTKNEYNPAGNRFRMATLLHRGHGDPDSLLNCAVVWVSRSNTLLVVSVGSDIGLLANEAEVIQRVKKVSDPILLSVR
jgi:hypothetical protein